MKPLRHIAYDATNLYESVQILEFKLPSTTFAQTYNKVLPADYAAFKKNWLLSNSAHTIKQDKHGVLYGIKKPKTLVWKYFPDEYEFVTDIDPYDFWNTVRR